MKMVGVNSGFNVQASHALIFTSLSHICHLATGLSRGLSPLLELELRVISVSPAGRSSRWLRVPPGAFAISGNVPPFVTEGVWICSALNDGTSQ